MIGARDVAFPRLNAFGFWVVPVRRPVHLLELVPRRRRRTAAGSATRRTPTMPILAGDGIDFWALGLLITGIALDGRRDQPHRHGPQHARAGHDADADAGVHVDDARRRSSCSLFAHAGHHGRRCSCCCSTATFGTPLLRSVGAAATRCCGSTCSGSSATPRCTSSSCPAFGIVSEVLPVFCAQAAVRLPVRRLLRASRSASSAWGVWAHHMFAVGPGPVAITAFAVVDDAHRRSRPA